MQIAQNARSFRDIVLELNRPKLSVTEVPESLPDIAMLSKDLIHLGETLAERLQLVLNSI